LIRVNPKTKIDFIFEDESLIVLNKPSGLLVLPDRFNKEIPCLVRLLEEKREKIFPVHRLDKDTSGVMVFAKDAETHKYLNGQFQQRKVEKKYWTLVHGYPKDEEGTIETNIAGHPHKKGLMHVSQKGKKSITHYKTIGALGPYSELEVLIETGRTHQIRVHMKHLGHTLAFDPLYGSDKPILLSSFKKKYRENRNKVERPLLDRLSLHAKQLKFHHPRLDKQMVFEAPLSKELVVCVKQLKKIFG